MTRVNVTKRADGETYVAFDCPGCRDPHVVPVTGPKAWGFNSSLERPTLTPSILVRYWDDDDKVHAVCHSFVRGGRIEFLNDCTHAFAGQTIDLPEIAE